MPYTSRKPPPPEIWGDEKLMALFQWMEGELDAIAQDSQETIALELRETQQAPTKPREGMIVRADGTGWNPGSGKGLYTYKSSAWVKVNEGTLDKYSSISDGSTTAAASGADTIRFRASSGLTVAVGSNDVTYGDNVLYSIDLSGLTAETAIATGDYVVLRDVSAAANVKMLVTDFLKIINALTEDTSPDITADFMLMYDTSAGAAKKVLPQSLGLKQLTLIDSGALPAAATKTINTGGTYKELLLVLDGISHNNGSSRSLQIALSDDGSNFEACAALTAAIAAATLHTGHIRIYNTGASGNKVIVSQLGTVALTPTTLLDHYISETGITSQVKLQWDGAGSFDAGSYWLYGAT